MNAHPIPMRGFDRAPAMEDTGPADLMAGTSSALHPSQADAERPAPMTSPVPADLSDERIERVFNRSWFEIHGCSVEATMIRDVCAMKRRPIRRAA